jgi:hypothetical protein
LNTVPCRRIRAKRERVNRTTLGMNKPVVLSMHSLKGKIKSLGFNSVSYGKLNKNTITIQRAGKSSNMICWRTEDARKA